MGPRASLHILEMTQISCPCWDLNPRSSTPYPSHYTGTTLSWLPSGGDGQEEDEVDRTCGMYRGEMDTGLGGKS